MSWLSVALHNNRNFAGNALKNVAPLAALIPGVGPLAAAGIAAGAGALGTGMREGTNIGDILKQGAQSGTLGYGAAKALPGIKAIGGSILGKGGATAGTPATTPTGPGSIAEIIAKAQAALDATKAAGGSGSGGLPGLGSIGDFLTGNSGLNALAAAQLANSAYLGQKSSNFADIAGKNADAAWQQKAPLRAQGVAGMDAGVAPVRLPGLAAISRASNPFARIG